MEKSQIYKKIHTVLKIVLPILCVLWVAFIFSNSLQTAEKSVAQSTTVVDKVQDMAQIIAPQSPVATAKGEAYNRLHLIIRDLAHFMQFMVLGVLIGWCYFVYTAKFKFFYCPVLTLLVLPLIDEWLQTFVDGRGYEWADIFSDVFGAFTGLAVAVLTFIAVYSIYKIKTREKATEGA